LKNGKVLRISVTDRCDLRCIYCMPETGVALAPHSEFLTYEEIETIARAAMRNGVRRFRITGGEPLVRRGIASLVGLLARLEPDDLALTTNGLNLAAAAEELRAAGLGRITISLDTLRPERFETITRRAGFSRILDGLDAARRAGLGPVKINTVVIRGVNDDEIGDFVRFAVREKVEVRFIELMPTSGLSPECKELGSWRPALFVTGREIRETLEADFGPLRPEAGADGVARIFTAPNGARIGLIMPVSDPFCAGCERLRLGPEGTLKLCLFDKAGLDLKGEIRHGKAGVDEVAAIIASAFGKKTTWDRGDLAGLSSEMFKIGG
jgi:GTP 3',8-cyclase